MNSDWILKFAIFGFFIGVVFRSFFDFGWAIVGLFALFALAFAFLKNWKIAILCLGLCLGIARYEWKDNSATVQLPGNHGLPGNMQGLIIDEPEEKDNYIRYRAELNNGTKVLLTARVTPTFEYGDRIKIEGKIKLVENFTNSDGEIFDWKSYLAKDEIYYEVAFPKLELLEHDQGNFMQARLFDLKHAFLARLARMIPEPESSLAGGLDLGAKESLGKDLLDKFRIAGLIHMVVLSGYNITIVAIAVMWLLKRKFSERVSIIAGIITILLFAIMTGGGATVFRASVMAVLGLLAKSSGRENQISRALIVAAFLLILVNPKVLVFDLGFQLSFLATLGLIYLEPIFRPHFTRLPEKVLGFKFREIASTTLAAQCAVFPLILYTFGNFSLYAFPVNMLVLPIVPITMLFIFLAGLFALVSSFIPPLIILAFPFAWISYALLAYMINLVTVVSELPLANLQFNHVPMIFILAIYAILICLIIKFYKNKEHLGVRPPSASPTSS